ncbi:MAG: secretion system protein [Acidobacteria bacterium]|jgi:type IV pilus assembly protein PilC|nr:secretion system protein [Acidobacteriota bacterium]MDP7340372.1 type II secretion system F family protein [Vicinamibacterales bacterium]
MEFRCRLGTQTGEVTEEMHVAESESKLRQELEAKGLYVLSLSRRGALGWPGLSFAKRRRIKTREFLVFNQELATLLRAGMPLVQSLDILRQRVEDPSFKAALDDVHDRVSAGAALSEAFEAQGETIPGIYTASLLAGEKSGGLEEVIRRYVAHVKVITAVKRKTLSALVYPAILLLLSLVVVSIIVLRVVPEFEGFYQSFDAELPIATRMIVAVSAFLRSYLFFVVLGLGGAVAAVWSWLRRPGGVAMLDRLILRLPAVGTIAGRFATSQLTRTLATLLSGGIPLVNAIDVASRALGNRFFADQLRVVGQRVREGEALAVALADRGVFPAVAIKMVEVGESTGALQEMLTSVADFFDEEIDTQLGRFITIIEPVLLVIMGVVIAALLIALYMPLLQLGSVLS